MRPRRKKTAAAVAAASSAAAAAAAMPWLPAWCGSCEMQATSGEVTRGS